MIKNENLTRLMTMVSELDQLKDKLNEAIEFFLDKKEGKYDDFHIDSIESRMADLQLVIEFASHEFSQK